MSFCEKVARENPKYFTNDKIIITMCPNVSSSELNKKIQFKTLFEKISMPV